MSKKGTDRFALFFLHPLKKERKTDMEINYEKTELKTAPAVFAIKDKYCIAVPVKNDVLFWVTVGDKKYYDHSNGIIRSAVGIHKVYVPMNELDSCGEYKVSYRKIIDRKPYFPELEDEVCLGYNFYPIKPEGSINIYHLADTHGCFEFPAKAAGFFGDDIDLLILNGDIPDHSGDVKNFDLIYELCSEITHGTKPCVFSRGNHDLRGTYAEKLADYTPANNGKSYYTFRLGRIWGILLDCGEDKNDDHEEYGGTVCCHAFRQEETEFLKDVVKNAETEYLADGIKYRLVISHVAFSHVLLPPFDIEQDTYKEWLDILKTHIKPNLMLCGHEHITKICDVGGEYDTLGQACPVIIGAVPHRHGGDAPFGFTGCALTLDGSKAVVRFTDDKKNIEEEKIIRM